MDRDDPLIDRLAADLSPVRPQRARSGWGLLGLAALATGVGVHVVFGLRPDTALQADGRWFLVGELVLATLGLACAAAVIGMASPQRTGRPAAFWVALAASLMPLVAIVLHATAGTHANALPDGRSHWECAALGTLAGTLVLATSILWLRRGAPAAPPRAGLYAGIAAGALGSAIYGLSCPVTGFHHWAVWHFVPVLVFALAGRTLVPRLLRW